MYLKNFLNKSLTIDYNAGQLQSSSAFMALGILKRLDCHYLSEQLAFFSLA